MLSLKTKKKISKKTRATSKFLEIARSRRKTLKKDEEKRKIRKNQAIIIFFIYKNFFFLGNTFGKT